jgi:alkanesulfonate monooxygenase SsuD/methylene tetrahydromethanopterin reductase-like flavin-dependent oxidoreductase (luciferase family)
MPTTPHLTGHSRNALTERICAALVVWTKWSRRIAIGRGVRCAATTNSSVPPSRQRRTPGRLDADRLQRPRIPILIGGHGPNVTFRLAAKYCDEINLDVLPAVTAQACSVLAQRCEEVGRDPRTLAVSISVPPSLAWRGLDSGGQRMMRPDEIAFTDAASASDLPSRAEALSTWREQGLSRVVAGVPGLALSDDPLYAFIDDCREAGLELAG